MSSVLAAFSPSNIMYFIFSKVSKKTPGFRSLQGHQFGGIKQYVVVHSIEKREMSRVAPACMQSRLQTILKLLAKIPSRKTEIEGQV